MCGKQAPKTLRGEATRRRLLDAADALFYEGGIRATGIEAIAEGAGVTKMTIYAHFASKDQLVVAYLEERDRRWCGSLEGRLGGQDGPREKLLAVFDAYRDWLVDGDDEVVGRARAVAAELVAMALGDGGRRGS